MTGKQIADFIKKHRLEECDEIILDNDTINFNITLSDGRWIMYSFFDFGVGEDIVLWPNPENAELGNKEISFDEALVLRGLKKEESDDV